jgi:hypothetical protein
MRTTVDEALAEFTLIGSAGSEAEKTACAMTLLAWLDECDEWTDHPQCAHRLITDQVIRANDPTDSTPEMRAELVRLGIDGVLDTWWIPTEVLVWTLSGERGEEITQYDRTVRALQRVIAWKGDKQRPDLTRANLTRAYLAGANLTRAYLAEAYLAGANLTRAYLAEAYLARANLTGANLTGAYLTGANLTRANLTRAYLAGANLTGANLAEAYLTGAYLAGANLTGANLTGAYLTGANGTPATGAPDGWELIGGLWHKS